MLTKVKKMQYWPLLLLSSLHLVKTLEIEDFTLDIDNKTLIRVHSSDRLVESLNISGLQLNEIESSAFHTQSHLKLLDLSNNNFSTLPINVFENLRNLETLSLANNNLSEISVNLFYKLTKLKLLDISGNKYYNLKENIFDRFAKETKIILSVNEISTILAPKKSYLAREEEITEPSEETYSNECSKYTNKTLHEMCSNITEERENLQCNDRGIANTLKTLLPIVICVQNGVLLKLRNPDILSLYYCSLNHFPETKYRGYRKLNISDNSIRHFRENWFRLPDFYKISILTIESSHITEIEKYIFNDLPPCIAEVQLLGGNIKIVEKDKINNKYISTMSLRNNNIETIESEAFLGLPLLNALDLGGNNLLDLKFLISVPKTISALTLPSKIMSNMSDTLMSNYPYLVNLRFQF